MIFRWFVLSALLVCSACGYQRRDTGQPQQIAHDKSGAALTFGDIDKVEGTRFFTIPILRGDGSKGGGSFSGSYRGSDERNRLIVDSATGASRKVLPNADFEVVNWIEPTGKISDSVSDAVDEAIGDQSSTSASGLYAAVVKRPGRAEKDPSTYDVLLGRFDDGKQVWIARGLAGVQAAWITGDGKLAMVAAIGDRGIYRLYDPKSFQQLLETPLNL